MLTGPDDWELPNGKLLMHLASMIMARRMVCHWHHGDHHNVMASIDFFFYHTSARPMLSMLSERCAVLRRK